MLPRLRVRGGVAALVAGLLGCASPATEPAESELSGGVQRKAQQAVQAAASKPAVKAPMLDEEVVITLSALGDCAIGDLRRGGGAPGSFRARLAEESDPMAYPFSGVAETLHGDDLTVANLEGTLTSHDGYANDVFAIRGKPEYAAMLTRGGVDLVDVDNNHAHDYGPTGHADTKAALEQAGVAYFGGGRADRRIIKGVRVVNLGYLGGPAGTRKRVVRDVGREKQQGGLVIVSFHWGVEGWSVTHPDQIRLGRAAIDAGADLVLGHHPHRLQGIETYGGRHIVYSLGNFVFGANSQPEDMDSIIYQERFRFRDGQLHGVEQLVIPVSISSTSHINDFRPLILQGAERQRVLSRLEQLSEKLAPGPRGG